MEKKNIISKQLGKAVEKKLRCPIIDGRIVSDITFATRFYHFLEDIQPGDAMAEEELEYMKMVAEKLLRYQLLTVDSPEEMAYFRNLV